MHHEEDQNPFGLIYLICHMLRHYFSDRLHHTDDRLHHSTQQNNKATTICRRRDDNRKANRHHKQ